MPNLKHLSADAAPEAISALLDSDGALILDDVIATLAVQAAEQSIDVVIVRM